MIRSLYLNLPVQDLPRIRAFFEGLGLGFHPHFSNEQAAALVINEHVHVMLLTRPFFEGFAPLPVADPRQATAALMALACDSRAEVDALVARAVALGATTPTEPRDMGFMFQHGFTDPEGHHWEVFWMDPAAVPPATDPAAAPDAADAEPAAGA